MERVGSVGGSQPEKSRNVGRGVPLIWQPCCSTRPPDLSSLPLREILAYVRIPRLTFELHNISLLPSFEYRIVPPSFFLLLFLSSVSLFSSTSSSSPAFPFLEIAQPAHVAIPVPPLFIASINVPRLIYTSICPPPFRSVLRGERPGERER